MGWANSIVDFIDRLWLALHKAEPAPTVPPAPPTSPVAPPPVPIAPEVPPTVPTSDWSTPKGAFHLTRVIADEVGLTLVQKNILCACIFQESRFLVNPKPNQNRDKTGRVWSTDFGIVQVNDYYNIGPGKPFPSVAYVLAHPEKCVRWMAGIYKDTGRLQPWASFTSKAYVQWLVPTSPMWALKS